MKPYQALLPLLLIAAISCTDDTGIVGIDGYENIVFGVSGSGTGSRSADETRSPDMFTLHPDSDNREVEPVKVYVTETDMTGESVSGRGTPVTGTDGMSSFGIYSFFYRTPTSEPEPFFDGETAIDKGDHWATGNVYYWPTAAESTLRFWAMAGIDAPGVSITRGNSSPEAMTINYAVPQRANDQADLMLATTSHTNTPGQRVPLRFSHLCAAVRFVFGDEMQPGTIKSIILSGIKSEGQYTTTWNNLSGNETFTIPIEKTTDENVASGTEMTPDYNTLMMIPQQLGENARLKVVFQDKVTGAERNLTAPIGGQTWKQGTTTTYHIGITPDFKLEFTRPVETQDAHYVTCNSAIRVSGLPADRQWTLTVEASDSSDPSVQLTADVNEFVRQGFWTDREMLNGSTVTNRSARGTSVIQGSGSGEFPLTVFLPENVSDANRTVTLTLSVEGAPSRYAVTQEIAQLHPLWVGDEGWEQIDDNQSGAYGFSYTAHHVYVYYDGNLNIGDGATTLRRIKSMIDNIIAQYNAGDYVDIYYQSYLSKYRYALDINYEKLSNLGLNASSNTDGLANTRQLFNFGGSAVSTTFESALQDLRRINDNNTKAFRKRDNTPGTWYNPNIDDQFEFPKWVEGTAINESQALTLALKKNRYYLNRYADTGTGMETTAPRITEDNIVWYLPAYQQFNSLPAGSFSPADFWSSTAYNNATQAYLGNGMPATRNTQKKVRVVRNR